MSKPNDQSHTSAGGALSLERMLFFSDAVFAIAITLLVLELHVPDLPLGSTEHDFWLALGHLWPKFFAFILSFLVIGRFWMSHHQLFERVHHFDLRLVWPNMMLLMAIAFTPFATAFLGTNLGYFVPAQFYNLTLLVTGLLSWRLLWRVEHLGLAATGNSFQKFGAPAVVLGALLCLALAYVFVPFSQMGMLTVPLWRWLLVRVVKV
ncbi:MAG: hypothetical protein RLY97_54 [Pseudomonadota bacterium]